MAVSKEICTKMYIETIYFRMARKEIQKQLPELHEAKKWRIRERKERYEDTHRGLEGSVLKVHPEVMLYYEQLGQLEGMAKMNGRCRGMSEIANHQRLSLLKRY